MNAVEKRFNIIAKILSLAVLTIGLVVIIGWIFDITILKSIFPSMVSMKANTAICFILIGLTLISYYFGNPQKRVYQIIGKSFSIIVILISALTLYEYFSGNNIGIDQLFFKDPNALLTSSIFIFISIVLLFSTQGGLMKLILFEKLTKEAEERYKTIYDCSSDAIMTLEPPTWNFTSGNNATIKMFRAKDEADFISHGPGDLSPEYQSDGRPSSEKAKEMIEKAIRDGSNSFEWTHKRINGEEFSASVLLSKVVLGDKVFLQATVRDTSELKLAEENLNKKIDELKRFNNLTIGRELKMVELKKRIAELKKES